VSQLNSDQAAQLHSIGSFLHQRRLELGVSLEEVSEKTRIRVPILHSIEEGDIALLPEPVYIKGLVRTYGNILQVDGNTLADTFPLESTPLNSELISKAPEVSAGDRLSGLALQLSDFTLGLQSSLKPYLKPILLFGGAVVGIAMVVSFRQPLVEAIAKMRPTRSTPEVGRSATPAPIVEQPSPQPVALPVDSGVEATIKLSADSWLQISTDGKVEFEGTLEGGTERKFVAKQKLTISAGNAGAVSVSINREPSKPLGNPGEVKEAIFTTASQ